MELELKHLAGYLPYGLKIHLTQFEQENIIIMKGVTVCKDVTTVWSEFSGYGNMYEKKLILRPISDLTKEIEVNGEQFVPKSILFKLFGGMAQFQILEKGFYSLNYGCYLKIEQLPHNIVSQLLEWHFDIYGLIENGLAISIHDVEEAGI